MSMSQISGEQIQEQARIISQVHRQLAAAFHPALKHVATAGVIYQKTQEANQKALSDYLLTLTQLVDSAKEAEEQTQECVQQLKAVIPIIKKFNDHQSQLITEFSEITRKVHANAEGEKDSHRKMLNSYLKEQRNIHKEVDKKRKTQKDLWEFYENKKLEAIRLQYLRYNFFTDKHLSIVKNFLNSSMEANNELARVFGMEQKHNIEEEIIHQNAMAMAVENQKRESIVSPENIRENIMPSPVLQRSSQRLKRLPPSESFPPYDGTITNFLNNLGEEDSPKSSRPSFVQPPQQQLQQQPQQQHYQPPLEQYQQLPPPVPNPRAPIYETREYVADPYPPLPPLPVANPLAPIYRPPTPIQQRPIPPPPREVIEPAVNPLPRPPKPAPQPQPYVIRDRPVSQPSYQYDPLERPVTILPNQPIQQSPPVIQPRKEKQLFTAADYGSILVCTMPYSARTDRQLSLNVNEQVQLIRSGERGWVLVKTSVGQKLGWFPAKFVQKATSEALNPQNFE